MTSTTDKASLRKKDIANPHKDYLTRIINLPIYSYTYASTDPLSHASNMISIGVLNADLHSAFNNSCLNINKFTDGFQCTLPDPSECLVCHSPKMVTPKTDSLLYYHILGFQQFHKGYEADQTDIKNVQMTVNAKLNALPNYTDYSGPIAQLQTQIDGTKTILTQMNVMITTSQQLISQQADMIAALQAQLKQMSNPLNKLK